MKKTALLLTLGGLFIILGYSCAVNPSLPQKTQPARQTPAVTSTLINTMIPGKYEDYSEEKLALATTGKVILFFKAGWCSECAEVNANIISHLTDIPQNIAILKVDYDRSTALKKKYQVTYQHTFVQVDAAGNLIKKWSGSPTLAEIIAQIK